MGTKLDVEGGLATHDLLSDGAVRLLDSMRGPLGRREYLENLIRDVAQPAYTKEHKRENGIEYTPPHLADYLAELAAEAVVRPGTRPRNLSVLDPACGEASLLTALANRLVARRQQALLCGIDLDADAVEIARKNSRRAPGVSKGGMKYRFRTANSLFPSGLKTDAGWKSMLRDLDVSNGFDLVIANPPWGASVDSYRQQLEEGDFSLFAGQFDTSDLFVELSLRLVKVGGVIAFIVPDSLFNAERAALRRLLLQQTELLVVARLGERLFKNINRACSIFVARRVKKPNPDHQVHCLRLTPELRAKVMGGASTLSEIHHQLSHQVPQVRFSSNESAAFDIDVEQSESKIFQKFRSSGETFGTYLRSSRGVELSKHGWVAFCDACLNWFPKPTSAFSRCSHCKSPIAEPILDQAVAREARKGWKELIVGESVQRYRIEVDRWIDVSRKGLKYKDASLYAPEKLLVRKTGVGIAASIDRSARLTNQVVYMFTVKDAARSPAIDFFLGLLNSRALYYYLAKAHGETEWRSHPYITQQQILDLPLPRLWTKGELRSDVLEIEKLVRAAVNSNRITAPTDAKVEAGVAHLFGLSRRDYEAIFSTIQDVQQLLPVKALSSVGIRDVFGE